MGSSRFVGKVLQRYWRLSRPLTMGAQGVVLDSDNRVLLIKHTYRPGWHFPGGGVEKNETVAAALKRELNEEAGIELTGPPQLLGLYANFHAFPSDHVALFVVREWHQPIVPEPNREISAQSFFSREELPDDTIAPVHRRLGEILDNLSPDETW